MRSQCSAHAAPEEGLSALISRASACFFMCDAAAAPEEQGLIPEGLQ